MAQLTGLLLFASSSSSSVTDVSLLHVVKIKEHVNYNSIVQDIAIAPSPNSVTTPTPQMIIQILVHQEVLY